MANNDIPLVVADLETQLSSAIAVGATSFTIASATDDDGVALPAGLYGFTVDNGSSNKEYFLGSLSGTTVSSVKTVTRQGTETSGSARAHRVGAPVIITDHVALQRIGGVVRGVLALDADNPLFYDADPTISDDKQLTTKKFVEDNFVDNDTNETVGGVKTFTSIPVLPASNPTNGNEATRKTYVDGLDSANVKLTGDQTIAGVKTFSSFPVSPSASPTTDYQVANKKYVDDTAIAGSPDASTTVKGISKLSTAPASPTDPIAVGTNDSRVPTAIVSATTGASDAGKTVKLDSSGYLDPSLSRAYVQQIYTSSTTWNKPAGLKYAIVEVLGGGGGSGGLSSSDTAIGGGGAGGYGKKFLLASSLGSSETVTIGAAGTGGTTGANNGTKGGTSSFGTHVSCTGGDPSNANSSSGGSGGTSTGGDINISGRNGGNALTISGSPQFSGFGADSQYGIGGISINQGEGNGNAATGYGAGGGGPAESGTVDRAGANGTAGLVIVHEYFI
jgi:hypothetical protein